jgi:hypothetical protein
VAQVVEHLLGKCKALSLIPVLLKKKKKSSEKREKRKEKNRYASNDHYLNLLE